MQIWQEQPHPTSGGDYTSVPDFKTRNKDILDKSDRGVKMVKTPDGDRIYLEITDIDLMVTIDQPSGKGKILHNEEIKTGASDSPTAARGQLTNGYNAINESAAGGRKVILLEGGKDITDELDLTQGTATSETRGLQGKGFDASLDVTSADLDAMVTKLLESPPPNP